MKTFVRAFSIMVVLSVHHIVRADEVERPAGLLIDLQHSSSPSSLTLSGTAYRFMTPRIGAFSSFALMNGYAEAYAGPAYAVAPWLLVGAGVGMEQPTNQLRFGTVAFVGNRLASALTTVEFGGSGFWARAECAFRPPFPPEYPFGFGLLLDTALGLGPRIEVSNPDFPVQAWIAPMVFLPRDSRLLLLAGLRLFL